MENRQKSRFLKNSTIYAIGNMLRQLVSFLMLPIYTKYLTPADYGVVGLVGVAITVYEALLGAKMVQALPKFYHDQKTEYEKNIVVSTAFAVTGIISATTVSVLFLFQDQMSLLLFADKKFGLIVGLCGVQILTQAMEYYALMYIRLIDRPVTFVAINFAKLLLQLSLNVYFVVHLNLGALGVAISGAISSALFAVVLSFAVLWKIGFAIDRDMAKRMLIFSWPLWLAGIASLYIHASNRYYIRVFDSLDGVGLYELAAKFSAVLSLLIWEPFAQYWQTEQFRVLKRGDADAVYKSLFSFVSTLLIVAGLGVSIFSDTVIRIMASKHFGPAALAVPFLMLATIFLYLSDFCSASFLEREKTGWISRNNYVIAVVVTLFYLSLIPLFGYVGAAAALAAAQFFRFLLMQREAKKQSMLTVPLLLLIVRVSIAAAAYFLANIVFQRESLISDVFVKGVCFIFASLVVFYTLWVDGVSRAHMEGVVNQLRERVSKAVFR